jgi:hypothetical protein
MATPTPLPFTARVLPVTLPDGTVHPPHEVSQGFVTLEEFKQWIYVVMGYDAEYVFYHVNMWLNKAKPGATILLNDDLKPSPHECAEFEIRRNY